jgi:predicted porin
MKKTLVAIAALAATSAFAQSSVEIYGTLDVGNFKLSGNEMGLNNTTNAIPASQSGTTLLNSFARQGTGTNNMGFRGKEDLGGGMYAGFNLQTGGLDLSNGNPGLAFSRESNLTLGSSSFGELKVGRSSSTMCSVGCSYDYNYIGSASALALTGLSPASFQGSSRRSDQIEWLTPAMSGFQGRFALVQKGDLNADGTFATNGGSAYSATSSAAGTATTASNYKNVVALGLTYANGPLRVGYVNEGKRVDSQSVRNGQWFGAEYNFGFVKANIQSSINPNKGGANVPSANGATTSNVKGLYALSTAAGTTTYGKGTSIALVAPVTSQLNLGIQAANNTEQGVKATELFAQYALSKRTTLYAVTTKLKGATSVTAAGVPATAAAGAAQTNNNTLGRSALQADPSIFGFGIRHTF